MYRIRWTASFKQDYKLAQKRGKKMERLTHVVDILASGEKLPPEYKDHDLRGDYTGYRECHVESDWLLVYKIAKNVLLLTLYRTGSHSDLFIK